MTTINTNSPNRSYTITGLTNDVTYKVRVAAVNEIGVGPFTEYVYATPSLFAIDNDFYHVELLLNMDQILNSDNYYGNDAFILGTSELGVNDDPYSLETAILLHGDGLAITDSSLSNRPIYNNANNTVVASTVADNKFGTASLSFNGSNYLTFDSSNDFSVGTNDFTIELFVKFKTINNNNPICNPTSDPNGADSGKWYFQYNGGNLTFGRHATSSFCSSPWSASTNTWYHLAVVRQSGIIKMFVDGVEQTVSNNNLFSSTNFNQSGFSVGRVASVGGFDGQIDEFRFTNGVARTISLPTSAYPNPTNPFRDLSPNPKTVYAVNKPTLGAYGSTLPAPTNIVPSQPQNGSLTLSWTAPPLPPGASDYIVQYSTDGGIAWTTVNDGISSNNSVTINNLANGSYIFRVAGTNGDLQSPWSSADINIPLQGESVQYLVVAGGGGGGSPNGGGGGAGGYRSSFGAEASGGGGSAESSMEVFNGTTYVVTVGAGGAAGSNTPGVDGGSSAFAAISSVGGGGGGGQVAPELPGRTGGSGGGAANSGDIIVGGTGTALQGFAGGNNPGWGQWGGGGGGAGGIGGNGNQSSSGGSGGLGIASTITGLSVIRASGGAAGMANRGATAGGGGASGAPGVISTGGGGGGSSSASNQIAGAGGGGVVIIRSPVTATATQGSPIITPASDPYFNNVSLLLHMDGDGNTFADASSNNRVISANGNITQSAIQSKFGGKSASFLNSNNNYLSVPYSSGFDFGTGDFTVEMWLYLNSITGQTSLFSATTPNGFSVEFQNSTSIGILRAETEWRSVVSVSTPIGQWFHLAVSRASGIVRWYINGSKIGSDQSDSYNYSMNGGGAFIGRYGNNNIAGAIDGYIDEIRITKGVARYTANFTPPTTAFPDANSSGDKIYTFTGTGSITF